MLRLEATKPLQNVLDREKTKVKKKAEKAAEIITAPYVLKRGVAVSGHRNHKGKGYPSVTFGGKVSINGVEGVEGVCVLYGDKDRVHSLRILAPNGEEFELIKNNTEVAKGGSTEGVDTPTKSVPNNILLPNTQKSQEENLIKNQVRINQLIQSK